MKTLILLFFPVFIFSQTTYQDGFNKGFKSGYCLNEIGCISPFPPVGQTNVINTYKNGYDNGFSEGIKQRGIDDDKKNKGLQSNSYSNSSEVYSQKEIDELQKSINEKKEIGYTKLVDRITLNLNNLRYIRDLIYIRNKELSQKIAVDLKSQLDEIYNFLNNSDLNASDLEYALSKIIDYENNLRYRIESGDIAQSLKK